MKISELVNKLNIIRMSSGDLEILVTDGYEHHCYRGQLEKNDFNDYLISVVEFDDQKFVDIGIGGCSEDY